MDTLQTKLNPIFSRTESIEITESIDITDQNQPRPQIHFQCLSWNEGDFEIEGKDDINQYEIYISGVNSIGQSVSLRVTGFTPYFYVLVPDHWHEREADLLFKWTKSKLWTEGYGLVGHDFVRRKKLYPFLAERKFKFVRLAFSTDKAFHKAKWIFSKRNQKEKPIKISGIDNVPYYEAFETNIKHLNRFCHIRNLETTGWIKITKFEESLEYTSAQINITTDWKNVFPDPDTKMIAPFTIFSWDIECLPANTEEFPNPELPGDVIKQISVVLVRYGSPTKQRFIFTSSPCSEIKFCNRCEETVKTGIYCEKCGHTLFDNAVVVEGTNEKNLLENFCGFISIVDPDIITGFNTWGFDDNYFWKRATTIHNISLSNLSRINVLEPRLIKKELSSSAYGNNEFNYLFYPGRETFDMIVAIRREHNLESTSLNFVGKHFLKESKIDLPYRVLFEKLNGGPDDIAECAAYCIQDSNLTLKLMLKLNMIPNYVEMAKATYVPMEWLLFRGQQCKCFSLIAKTAREQKYVIPVYEKSDTAQKFQGATVISPKIGMYYDPIAGLDFASLYPSIMMAYNMCYSTIIVDKDILEYAKENNIPFKTVTWETCVGIDTSCKGGPNCGHDKETQTFTFVQAEDNKGKELPNGVRGLLGTILKALMTGRKATKELAKYEKDPFMKAVYNGKQLAQKVTMNSIYGFTGAENGILPLKAIASSVTATGRQNIDHTSKIVAEKYGGITVYGDSIPGDELITIRGIVGISCDMSIEKFANGIKGTNWESYRGFKIDEVDISCKEYKNLEGFGIYTLTHNGYQPIKKVIRHKTNKKIYKIIAKDEFGKLHSVRVTEGHSLIAEDGTLITPTELTIGSELTTGTRLALVKIPQNYKTTKLQNHKTSLNYN